MRQLVGCNTGLENLIPFTYRTCEIVLAVTQRAPSSIWLGKWLVYSQGKFTSAVLPMPSANYRSTAATCGVMVIVAGVHKGAIAIKLLLTTTSQERFPEHCSYLQLHRSTVYQSFHSHGNPGRDEVREAWKTHENSPFPERGSCSLGQSTKSALKLH